MVSATVRKFYSSPRHSPQNVDTSHDTPYAVSDGCYVVGTHPHLTLTSNENEANGCFIKWKTSFNDEISRLVSTADGSIIAVTTMAQSLSLIRGGNGDVLASRSIRPKVHEQDSKLLSQGVTFVQNSKDSVVKDVLVIPYLANKQTGDDLRHSLNILMVCGINGVALNEGNNDTMREALMQISKGFVSISIEFPVEVQEILCLRACFINEKVIRFVVVDSRGRFLFYDYDVVSRDGIIRHDNLSTAAINDNVGDVKWSFDERPGSFQIDCHDSGTFLIVMAISNTGRQKICWFDLTTLKLLSQYEMERQYKISKIYCIQPIHSPEHTVAVGIALQKKMSLQNNENEICIIQAGLIKNSKHNANDIDHDLDLDLELEVSIVHPQIVFTIPIEEVDEIIHESHQLSAHICSIEDEYSFTYRTEYENHISFWEFKAAGNLPVGKVKGLLSRGLLDEAEKTISELSHDQLSCKYGMLHNSEIALWRFKHMLNNEKILSQESKDQVREIFRRLATGAVSGGEHGLQSLLKASKTLRDWPRYAHNNCIVGPQIRDYRMVMSAMSMNIANAMKGVSSRYTESMRKEINLLEAKSKCLKCIEYLISSGKEEIPLGFELGNVNDIAQLFNVLVASGLFIVAERVRKYDAGCDIGPQQIASSVVSIPTGINPHLYCSWLEEQILPFLIFNEQNLDLIKDFVCTAADFFDEDCNSFGIDASILLLDTVSKTIANASVDKYISFPSHLIHGRQRKENNGSLTDGNILDVKLFQANLLKQARNLGLQNQVRLGSFIEKGGARFIAKALVRVSCEYEGIESFRLSKKKVQVIGFCQNAGIRFDDAVSQYAEELCDTSRRKAYDLKNASTLTQLCSDPEIKCQIALSVLRSAQLSSESIESLRDFAKMAIQWAQQDEIKSELEEVTRLLVIDDIVRRYCGQKAVELFRVSDSLHSSRLLNYICRCINMPSQLEDVIFLCESFTHLSRVDACVLILERVTLTSKSTVEEEPRVSTGYYAAKCEEIVHSLAKKDIKDAKSVAILFCMFCSEMTHQISKNPYSYCQEEMKRLFPACCSAAIAVGSIIAQQLTLNSCYKEFQRLQSYCCDFQRLQYLFLKHSLVLSLDDLRRGHKSHYYANFIIESSLQSWTNSNESDPDLRLFLKSAKRGVSKLCEDNILKTQNIWCKALASVSSSLLRRDEEDLCLKVLEASGILNEIRDECAYNAIISTVIALCSKDSVECSQYSSMSSMRRLLIAGSLLQDHVLTLCSQKLLPSVVFLNNATDIITQVILRADCGVGEKMDAFKSKLQEKSHSHKPLSQLRKRFDSSNYLNGEKSNLRLHPTWYVGDGLLLPPTEAMTHCMMLFKELIIQSFLLQEETNNSSYIDKSSCIDGLYEFLHSRGAYSISSRMLMCTFTVNLTSVMETVSVSAHSQIAHEIIYCIAERSLGSSGSGNTSGNVDSELAVYSLLSLPIKVAFKVYRRCLPSAISGRDFSRLLTLANVGLRAAGVKSHFEESLNENNYSWKKQLMFISQCQSLLDKARWWKILQYFNVSFDPNGFEEVPNKENDMRNNNKSLEHSKRIEGVLSDLICHASEVIEQPDRVTDLAVDFAQTFHLDSNMAIQRYIEFLLSWPENLSRSLGKYDIRKNLDACEEMTKRLLDLLPTHIVRSSVLRRCLMALEKTDESGRDFERYFLVLSLYKHELCMVLEDKTSQPRTIYFEEIQRIDRRLDALAIISSFFVGKPYDIRPLFQKCFISLTESKEVRFCGVLGNMENEKDVFDPLLPLRECLKNKNSTSALAPLCSSLGLPSGFIHARALVEQMHHVLPSFQTQILPTVKRLKNPKDGAKLSEWCANQYPSNSSERLECLQLAESLAIQASNEAENILRRSTNNANDILVLRERDALDTVKRITAMKRVLADEVLVVDTLRQYQSQMQGSKINITLSTIVEKVKLVQDADPSPEKLVENLLIQGSLQVAEASLDRRIGLSQDDFFTLSLATQHACKCLEDRYSHIDLELISTTLVRRWLLHGDDTTKPSVVNASRLSSAQTRKISMADNSMSIDEEETSNFVLDLKAITSGEDLWSEDVKSENTKQKENITLDEEPSSFKKAPLGREASEYSSARVGLRVAFILFDRSQNTEIKKRARYLLKVAFARTTLSVDRGLRNISLNTSNKETPNSKNNKAREKGSFQAGKALTFAMRYRALRAVSVLCDKQLLESIIAEDKFFDVEKCSFSKCCFGSLLAKESESMRLSLPHSDLEQLSCMHHPSYARTLWKHFRHTDCSGFKGRYLLLLFELSLREEKITDFSLLKILLQEITDDRLPRTMLLACECLAGKNNLELIFASDEEVGIAVLKLSRKLAASIINELNEECDSRDVNDVTFTLNRLGKVVQTFVQNGISSEEILNFVKMLCKIGESNKNNEIVAVIFEVAASISFQLNKATRTEAISVLQATAKGREVLKARIGIIGSTEATPILSRFDCFDKLLQLEREYKEEIAAAFGKKE